MGDDDGIVQGSDSTVLAAFRKAWARIAKASLRWTPRPVHHEFTASARDEPSPPVVPLPESSRSGRAGRRPGTGRRPAECGTGGGRAGADRRTALRRGVGDNHG